MKICVFSDSHGCAEHMITAIRAEAPDCVIHLGDGARDLLLVHGSFPGLPIHSVRGNCDTDSDSRTQETLELEGKRIFITHGHLFHVQTDPSFQTLCYAALEKDADIVLFGHTHIPYRNRRLCMELMNPGTIGQVPSPAYGLISIDGQLSLEIKYPLTIKPKSTPHKKDRSPPHRGRKRSLLFRSCSAARLSLPRFRPARAGIGRIPSCAALRPGV